MDEPSMARSYRRPSRGGLPAIIRRSDRVIWRHHPAVEQEMRGAAALHRIVSANTELYHGRDGEACSKCTDAVGELVADRGREVEFICAALANQRRSFMT